MPFRRVRDPERLQALVGAMLLVAEDVEITAMLRTIAQTAVDLVGARYGALGVLDAEGTRLAEFVTVGVDAGDVAAIGDQPQGLGILGLLIKDPRALRIDDIGAHPERAGFPAGHPPMRSFLGAPITVAGRAYGNLYLCDKRGADGFDEDDEDVVGALALAAGLAVDKARLYVRMRDLTLVEERERIARDLHANVIQRLFAVGLSLQGSLRLEGGALLHERLQEAVDGLDDTIRQIRSTIFAISRPRRMAKGTSAAVLELVEAATKDLDLRTSVDLDGPIDDLDPDTAEHLLVSLREAVSNVVRHARATTVDVEVHVDERAVTLRVVDDGVGFLEIPVMGARGISMLEERAKLLGGSLDVRLRPERGTELIWRVRRPPRMA